MKLKTTKIVKTMKVFYLRKVVAFMAVISLVVNLIIETFSRHSLIAGISHIFNHPVFFIYNSLVIFLTLCIGLFLKKRNSWIVFISTVWLVLGGINGIVLFFRVTPMSLIDFAIAKSGITMLHIYLNIYQMILLILASIALIVTVTVAIIKIPKSRVDYKKASIVMVLTIVLVSLSTNAVTTYSSETGAFAVLTKAYDNMGFVYCFARSVIDNGIDKPRNYSKIAVEAAIKKLNKVEENTNDTPNLIVLQLESFFDVSYLKNITCSENPIPNFTKLKNECSSGKLKVPSIGGGTANTEFEVLTGMDLNNFGIGEYPYQTILRDTTCESLAYSLKSKGYRSTAIHNHTATFYGRNKVYPNLGFDAFLPVEYMTNVERNELSWAKDEILTNKILETLKSSEEKDFIFAVSVQAHGKYPKDEIEYNKIITAGGFDLQNSEEVEFKNEFEYYINQIYEVDKFLGELISALEEYSEPVMLVVYGDHLPALDITSDDLEGITEYQTEYCIWTNYKKEKNDKDIYSYQLSSVFLNELKMDGGLLPRIHQTFIDDERYEYYIKLLSYDMLYGNGYSLNKKYTSSDMRLGLKDVKIDKAFFSGDSLFVSGDGFNQFSYVMLDNKKMNTTYINENMLAISGDSLEGNSKLIRVSQINTELIKLGTTEEYSLEN